MGTITRSFANNITTSGVLLPASLTNDSIANVTAYNASVATGGMVLVSSATASASATIDFTLGDYKEYQFYFVNMHPSVSNRNFEFQGSTDSGSTYGVTITSTAFVAYHAEDDSETIFGYNTVGDLAQSTNFQMLSQESGHDADSSVSGTLSVFNPSSTTYVKHFTNVTNGVFQNTYTLNQFHSGYFNITSALTNLRFQMSSGNIDRRNNLNVRNRIT
jgi:hypothetical protein